MSIENKEIELNDQFKHALNILENTNKNILITGRAGTGKSTLLNYFVNHTEKSVVVLAPTGVAAVNIQGQTIHSFFSFKPTTTIDKVKKIHNDKIYKAIDTIIIDEISMVRADLLDCVNKFLILNGKDRSKPFGGVQMVFIGDLYQLPPIIKGKEIKLFNAHYISPYFFDAFVFKTLDVKFIELEKVYRQTDERFIYILNAIRNKSITDEDLKEINKKLNPNFQPNPNDFYIHLTTTNQVSEEINAKKLDEIKSELFVFTGKIKGNFDKSYLPTGENLQLKIGSQIMLVNNDKSHRWVNGTVGKIIAIEENKNKEFIIKIELSNGEIVNVGKHKWELSQLHFNDQTKKLESEIIGSFIQYPIKLAWAITIHKGQGKTFEKIIIDIGKGAFTPGQIYVALSRCTSLEGIILRKKIEKNHIWTDWRVIKFLTKYQYKISENNLSLKEKMELIEKAIKSNHNLNIIYLKSNDQKSKRTIKPEKVGKMEYLGGEYIGVEGYCFKRNDNRVFRVDRILELNIEKV